MAIPANAMSRGPAIAAGTTPNLFLSPFMAQLQQIYGSFDPNRVQTRRREVYSFVAYPTAGAASFTFFSQTVGTTNRQLTNIQRSGHLDNPLIVRAIRTGFFITAYNGTTWSGTDASTLYSDIVNGFFQAGVMRVIIGSKEWLQLPCPFQYAPPGEGMPKGIFAGQYNSTTSRSPFAYLGYNKPSSYIVDPSFMIGSDQNFQVTIEFPSGLIPAIGTGIVTSGTVLYIGVKFDGIEVRPLQ